MKKGSHLPSWPQHRSRARENLISSMASTSLKGEEDLISSKASTSLEGEEDLSVLLGPRRRSRAREGFI